jgi:hypothetical protein
VIKTRAPLDRILVQNRTGYSAPLNRFQRPDLQPATDYAGIPAYATEADLRADGLLAGLENLSTHALATAVKCQIRNIASDLRYLQSLIAGG